MDSVESNWLNALGMVLVALATSYESKLAMRLPMQWSLAAYGALVGVRRTS